MDGGLVEKAVLPFGTPDPIDTTTAMGRAMIGENVRNGLVRRAQSGKYADPIGGNPRFGYTYSPDEGKLLVEPWEAEVVRTIFDPDVQSESVQATSRSASCEGNSSSELPGLSPIDRLSQQPSMRRFQARR